MTGRTTTLNTQSDSTSLSAVLHLTQRQLSLYRSKYYPSRQRLSHRKLLLLKPQYLPAPPYPSHRTQLSKGKRRHSPGTHVKPQTALSTPVSARYSSKVPCVSRLRKTQTTPLPAAASAAQRLVSRPIFLSTFHLCRFSLRNPSRMFPGLNPVVCQLSKFCLISTRPPSNQNIIMS